MAPGVRHQAFAGLLRSSPESKNLTPEAQSPKPTLPAPHDGRPRISDNSDEGRTRLTPDRLHLDKLMMTGLISNRLILPHQLAIDVIERKRNRAVFGQGEVDGQPAVEWIGISLAEA
jgi:hypothetical protein